TDVYALGMILFEMMAGKRPYELGRAALSEAVRVICEEPPARLDLSMGGSRGAHADLATIVGKSLEKEPDRRYPSAGALSEDVERYLSSEPIVARPPSRVYQTRMFVKRHRFGVSAAATLAILLTAFGIAMAIQSRRIAREAEVSRRVSEYMTRMFQVSDPSEARGNTITAREILDKASKEISTGLASDPEIQARLMHTMGQVYNGLGLYPKAAGLLEQSLGIQRRRYGTDRPETLRAMVDLGTIYDLEGRFKETERLFLEALPLMRRRFGPQHPDTLRLMNNLGVLYSDLGRYPEAEKLGLEVVRDMKKALGPTHPETLNAMTNLANVYHYQGRLQEAGKLVEEVLRAKQRVLGAEHPATLASMNNLAINRLEEQRIPEAEKLFNDVIALERKVLGPDHPDTLGSMNNLGNLYYQTDRVAEAERLNLEILAIEQRTMEPTNPDLGNTLYSLACLRARQGDSDGALARLREARNANLPVAAVKAMAADPDLATLHADPRFQALLREFQRGSAVSHHP
ncbi:MAG TPA: tetratricopeptide repeat-containing protein kinase family protein, partial [Holophagaceae bacterium]|nr:tetratricopeptide repeat-containing protein kinase family protein [Holophagaceae bacterium]